jgi:hypothetical protein
MQTIVAPTGVSLPAVDRKQRAAWLDQGIEVFEREMTQLLGKLRAPRAILPSEAACLRPPI